MIISGEVVTSQGLTGDLAILSSMLGWETKLYPVLMESISKRNDSGRGRVTEWEDGTVATVFPWEHEAKDKRRKEWQWAMNQGWERREQRLNLLRSRCFVVLLFFFCWHSEHSRRRQRLLLFFIGHMPLHDDLWMQPFCRRILLSMHYVAQPSVAIWGSEEASPLTHSLISSLLLSHPSYHTLDFFFTTSPSFQLTYSS